MANVISLDTTSHPGLTQILLNTPQGLFDFKAQMLAGSVTVTSPAVKSAILAIKNPANGKPYAKET